MIGESSMRDEIAPAARIVSSPYPKRNTEARMLIIRRFISFNQSFIVTVVEEKYVEEYFEISILAVIPNIVKCKFFFFSLRQTIQMNTTRFFDLTIYRYLKNIFHSLYIFTKLCNYRLNCLLY